MNLGDSMQRGRDKHDGVTHLGYLGRTSLESLVACGPEREGTAWERWAETSEVGGTSQRLTWPR